MVRHQLSLHRAGVRKGSVVQACLDEAVDEFLEAKELGITTRPVILGPVSFLPSASATIMAQTLDCCRSCCRFISNFWKSSRRRRRMGADR